MCRPPTMMKTFAQGFHRLGVRANRVLWGQFGAR
jgi:hypothetical protein